jgi:cellulose synthase/poly-beta-1,6-N-acetylglucosamine synthase-like glycosyltransferase
MWATLIFTGTAALFLAMSLTALWHLRWVRRLPALEAFSAAEMFTSPPEGRVRCSVVIAARNEEVRIEQTVRHALAQRGVEAEIIVVDDRSTDRTGEILR